MNSAQQIDLSLVAHTNVGKTTLMRTLVRRDIGEVADRAHVTEQAEVHTLIDTPQGDVLRVWDTPGFGDSARLLKRLRASTNPIGWVLSQVWDRFTDRPFFCSQQAIRNVRDESDVVLYLVSAAEDPASAAYVQKEMEILAGIGKPVVVLLNQMGPPRGAEAQAVEEALWSRHLAAHVGTRGTRAMDAFARCWVQEDELLGVVGSVLPEPKRAAFERLRSAWRMRNLEVFDAAMHSIAVQLAAAAADREVLDANADTLKQKAGRWLTGVTGATPTPDPLSERAMNTLARRFDAALRDNTDRLIALHGLSGQAKEGIYARLAGHAEVARPADLAASGVLGGIVSGALGGLAADLAAGGLTFGAGALIGGIAGALGASGAARAYNLARGTREGAVHWSPEFLTERFASAVLRYLAVAHYGRGRGDWAEGEYPPHWGPLVAEVTAQRREEVDAVFREGGRPDGGDDTVRQLEALLAATVHEVLLRLYPKSSGLFHAQPRGSFRVDAG